MSSSSATADPRPKHQWSQALDSASHLPGSHTAVTDVTDHHHHEEDDEHLSPVVDLVSPFEAESIVSSDRLRAFPVEEVGTSEFLLVYGRDVERLSLQAHVTARRRGHDEYVVEALVSHDKVGVLVETLIAVEAWRTLVLPRLAADLAAHGNALRCAFTIHVETTLVGLLNLVLHREDAARDALDAATAVALVDYCARSLTKLSVPLSQNDMLRRQKEPLATTAAELSHRVRTRTALEEMEDHRLDAEFKTCVAAVALARYLCEHADQLPVAAVARIADTHDFLVAVVPLIDEPPWTRRRTVRRDGDTGDVVVWEKYGDSHRWEEVAPADLLRLTRCEAQPWLAVFHLICDSESCRQRYALNTFRKEQLLRLRRYLNDTVVDQLPVLAEVMRRMDELAVTDVPESTTGRGAALRLQQVDAVRERLLGRRGNDDDRWEAVARAQFRDVFSRVTDAGDDALRSISEDVYSMDGVEDVLDDGDAARRAASAARVGAVTLRFRDDDATETYALVPATEDAAAAAVVVDTPHGPFERSRMDATRASDADDATSTDVVCPNAAAFVDVTFEGRYPFTTTLECADLRLPSLSDDNDGDDERFDSFPNVEWRQIGSMQERLALQIGFRKVSNKDDHVRYGPRRIACYALHTAFMSKPCSRGANGH